jgi:hypothetical protein
MSDDTRNVQTEFRAPDDLAAELGEDLARRLLRHAHHTDRDGRPVLPAERADDLLGLLAGGWL